mgnify:FL=1
MIKLSDHFDTKRLIKYTFPSIMMMIFTSIYSIVDGFFVSNYAGKTPFAAVNFIMPVLMIVGCVGFIFGTGGSALIAVLLGEKRRDKANEVFTQNIVVSALIGALLAIITFVATPRLAALMGAEGQLLSDSVLYCRINLLSLPFFVLQFHFQCLFATAEKPRLGLIVTVAAGSANIILDFVFVGIFKWALVGAAAATVISQIVGGLAPLIYFGRKNTSLLRLTKFHFNGKALLKTLTNGSSEFLSNVSMSLVSMLYNIQLLKYSGENGVAAYGVLMYVGMIFQSIFIGYAVGSAPIVSYNYGAEHYDELKNLKKRGTSIIIASSIMMLLFGEIFGRPFSRVFVGYDEELLEITAHAFAIFSFSFLFSGYSIFGSSFFTALNNGLISALNSVLRTLVFQVLFVLILPIFFGLDGVWLSIIGAEVAAVFVTITFMIKLKKRYNY